MGHLVPLAAASYSLFKDVSYKQARTQEFQKGDSKLKR